MRKVNIGRGSKMSIAKAALIYFYGDIGITFLHYGDLDAMHKIVDIAGAKHASFFTPVQVSSCLANSPYWEKTFICGFFKGFRGHGGANAYKPSEKGKEYYQKHLKN